jgi:putative spermidine/putrescine transport system permease protein
MLSRTLHYVLPGFLVLFFLFMLAPIVVVVVISFQSAEFVAFPIESFSLRWFVRIIDYAPFRDALLVSFEIAIGSAILACMIGVPAALAVVRMRSRAADLITTFLLSPLSIPLIVLGFALLFYLSAIGFGVSFLSLLMAHTVVSLPYIVRTVAGVYRGLSPQLEESAAILGATPWQSFRYVTLPLIKPGIFGGALLSILISLDNLPVSYFFGSARTMTLPVVMLSYLETSFDPSIAALSTVQLLIAVIALFVIDRVYGLASLATAL